MALLAVFAFLSGIVTILSPCILPVLPIVLSGSIGGKRRPLGIIVGFISSFTVFTLLLSAIVRTLQIPPDAMRTVAIIIIITFGLVMIIPKLQLVFESLVSRINIKTGNKEHKGFGGGILIGASLGLVWTPCVGPIIASVISLAISRSIDGGSFIIVLAYSFGTAIPMTGIMLGGRKLLQRVPALTANTAKIQRTFGVLLLAVGVSIGFGLDRRFQATVLEVFPKWGTGLAAFEDNDSIREALANRNKTETTKNNVSLLTYDNQPKNGKLNDLGKAPPIITEGKWFNSNPLTMESLKGKVVLVDFWTYSCVNCVRTIPHLQSWYEAYHEDGLEIIGVHTPEFAFEQVSANVEKALIDLGITWPVVMDNDYKQWRSYNNRYWPAKYFIDAEGNIRYFHFGEGQYDEAEKVIRKLLAEAGKTPGLKAEEKPVVRSNSRTPETYLGYKRTQGFISPEPIQQNTPAVYSFPDTLEVHNWAVKGEWRITREYISPLTPAVLELKFNAKNVFLVIAQDGNMNKNEPGSIRVLIDGTIPPDTDDVKNGMLTVEENKLYSIVELPKSGEHLLSLEVSGSIQLYAFTFG